MRPRGIWIAICMILIVGIFSTNYIKRRTSDFREPAMEESMASGENYTKNSVLETDEEISLSEAKPQNIDLPADGSNEPEALAMEADDGSDDAQDFVGLQKTELSDGETSGNPVRIRLQELDDQIARNRSRDADKTAISRKASAESEWMLWETELQRILGILKENLGVKEQEILMQQQKEWMRSRENQSVDAAQKQLGSSLEEVNYNRSLARLTRERVYELAEEYEALFMETAGP